MSWETDWKPELRILTPDNVHGQPGARSAIQTARAARSGGSRGGSLQEGRGGEAHILDLAMTAVAGGGNGGGNDGDVVEDPNLQEGFTAYAQWQAAIQKSLKEHFKGNWTDVPRYIKLGHDGLGWIPEEEEEGEDDGLNEDVDAPVPDAVLETATIASFVEESRLTLKAKRTLSSSSVTTPSRASSLFSQKGYDWHLCKKGQPLIRGFLYKHANLCPPGSMAVSSMRAGAGGCTTPSLMLATLSERGRFTCSRLFSSHQRFNRGAAVATLSAGGNGSGGAKRMIVVAWKRKMVFAVSGVSFSTEWERETLAIEGEEDGSEAASVLQLKAPCLYSTNDDVRTEGSLCMGSGGSVSATGSPGTGMWNQTKSSFGNCARSVASSDETITAYDLYFSRRDARAFGSSSVFCGKAEQRLQSRDNICKWLSKIGVQDESMGATDDMDGS
ncbi:hypothetical protein FB451DRAFT_1167663 [Mycena latifolia]|nr:hypothetical protein FB451DRAFT_1167663 [Mycena latifolia]